MAKDKRLKRMRKLGVDYGPMAGAEQLRWRFAARRVLKKSHRADYSPSEAEQKVRESAARGRNKIATQKGAALTSPKTRSKF